MRERPAGVEDSAVLAAVRSNWAPEVDRVDYRAVGFGAHHWCALRDGVAVLFVTVEALGPDRDLTDLAAAYAGAAMLAASGLEFVHAGLHPFAVPFADAAISATLWLDGESPDEVDRETTRRMLARLHAVPPPPIPTWRPIVTEGFASELRELARRPWTQGPYGERSREAIGSRLAAVAQWTERYHRLVDRAARADWVPTHGEPHQANQVVVSTGTVLVDWESLKLAPAERDLRVLEEGRPEMLEMLDLEWRLDEIRQYARWFSAEHGAGADDEVAFAALEHELQRP